MSQRAIEDLVALGVKVVLGLVILGVVYALWHGYNKIITAPVQTQLDVSRANNASFKAAEDKRSEGVKTRAAAGKKREEQNAKDVQRAGQEGEAAAARVQAKPAVGETDYERMVNRIDSELGLR